MAALFGHSDVVEHLLLSGADKELCNIEGETPADCAKGFTLAEKIRKYSS